MLDFMQEILSKFLNVLCTLLPLSPFSPIIAELGELPFLGYLNWFLPIDTFCAIGGTWLVSVGVYYLYSVVARWVKLIE